LKKKKSLTLGAESLRLYSTDPGTHSADEQMSAQLEDYEKNVFECIKTNIGLFDGDFYVVVLSKKERLMQNVMRGLFFARRSCPTPDYDQAVYKYTKDGAKLELMWVIPACDVVNLMKNNPQLVETSKYALLSYVMKFADGTLLRLAKEINGEKRDSNILDK